MSDLTPDLPDGGDVPDLGSLLEGLTGGGGGFGDLFAQAQEAMLASQSAATQEVEGSAGGGVVRIRANGGGEVLAVTIDPVVVDPSDVAGLEDLVVAAFRDVHARIGALHREAMGGLDPTSMLGGFFGGPDEDDDDADVFDDDDE